MAVLRGCMKSTPVFYVAGAVAAIAIGWLAAKLHVAGFAPIGLLSLGIGIALGAALCSMAASQRLASRRQCVVGALVMAIVTVLAEHAWLYQDFRRQWHEARAESAAVALFRPETPWSPAEYFARELTPGRAALWVLDAVLITAAAVGVVIVWSRRQHLTPTPDT